MQATATINAKPYPGEEQRTAIAVILVVALALILAWGLKTSVEGRATHFTGLGGAISLRYPSSWMVAKGDDGTLLTVRDGHSAAAFNPTFSVHERNLAQGQRLIDAATAWTLGRTNVLREFHDLGTEQTKLAGRDALLVNYAYVADPPPGSGPATLPVVVRAADTIVAVDSRVLIFSTASDASQGEVDARFKAILASIKLK